MGTTSKDLASFGSVHKQADSDPMPVEPSMPEERSSVPDRTHELLLLVDIATQLLEVAAPQKIQRNP